MSALVPPPDGHATGTAGTCLEPEPSALPSKLPVGLPLRGRSLASKRKRQEQAVASLRATALVVVSGAAGYVEGTEQRIGMLALLGLISYFTAAPLPKKRGRDPKSGHTRGLQKKFWVLSTSGISLDQIPPTCLSFPSAVVPRSALPGQGQGAKVERPAGRTTSAPWPWSGRSPIGTAADGKLRPSTSTLGDRHGLGPGLPGAGVPRRRQKRTSAPWWPAVWAAARPGDRRRPAGGRWWQRCAARRGRPVTGAHAARSGRPGAGPRRRPERRRPLIPNSPTRQDQKTARARQTPDASLRQAIDQTSGATGPSCISIAIISTTCKASHATWRVHET